MATNVNIPKNTSLSDMENPPLDSVDYSHLRITAEKDIPHPPPVLTIGGAPTAAVASVTMISAEPKGGKTALMSAECSAMLAEDGLCDGFPAIEARPNYEKKAIVDIDTEQSEADQQDNVRGKVHRSGHKTTPSNYYAFNFRQLSLSELKTATNAVCEQAEAKHGGIYCIFIDGIADYTTSVNDETEANAAIAYCTQLSIKYNCPVITVIHLNPTSSKERGHIGSQLGRKCYATITLTKKDDISTIAFKYMRKAGGSELQPISFKYDKEKGYHVQMDYDDTSAAASAKAVHQIEILKNLVNIIFKPLGKFTHKEAIKQVMFQKGCGVSTAKTTLNDMVAIGFVIKGNDGFYRKNDSEGQRVNEGQNEVDLTQQ